MDQQVGNLYVASIYTKNQITKDWLSLLQFSNSTNNSQNITTLTNNPINTPENIATWQNDIHLGEDTLQLIAERRVQYVNATYSPIMTGFANTTSLNASRTTDSVAGSYQFKSGANLLTAAVRNDDISGYGSKATGSIAYGYFFTKEVRANVNYGTGFRAPTFNDLYYPGYGNVNLQPETNKNLEAGLHYEVGSYGVHLVGYENKINNLIVPLPCATQITGYCPTNFAKTQITGATLGANALLGDLTLKGSYDLTNAIDVATGLMLPNRAKNTVNLGADYRFAKTNVGANLTLAGTRYGDAADTQVMGGYALMNLYLNQELDKNWSLFAKWNNIFNAQYQLAYGYLTPGSNIFVGVRYTGN
jgi:vitamin B12 transporter